MKNIAEMKNIIVAWVKKLFRIKSPSLIWLFGYEYEYDYLMAKKKEQESEVKIWQHTKSQQK